MLGLHLLISEALGISVRHADSKADPGMENYWLSFGNLHKFSVSLFDIAVSFS